MINKKRQELLINNLRSISAEVRKRSLQQLVEFPAISMEEKKGFLETALQDSDEEVRACAASLLAEVGGQASGGLPENSAINQPNTPPIPPNQGSGVAEPPELPSLPPLAAQVPAQEIPPTTDSQHQNLAMPDSIAEPAAPDIVEGQFSGAPAPVLPSMDDLPEQEPLLQVPASAPVLDEVVDSSLPDLKKMTSIPALLDHIRLLTDTKPTGHLSQLLQLADSVQEEVGLSALQALLNLKDKRVPPQVLFMLSNENYSSQRRFLMLKVILDNEMALDFALLEKILINEKDVIVKSGLVKVFARNSREKGLNTLISCLQDPDPRVRANTVEVIEEQAIKGCEQHIIELLQDPENRVKVNAAKFLVKNGYQQAFLTLRSMLVSSEVWLRDSVIFALGEIGDQASLTLLKAALKDPNQGIRLSVLKSLAKINNSTSRQVLRAASGDPDPIVAQVANSLWEKLKDAPLREDVKAPPAMELPTPQAPVPVQPPAPPVAPVAPVPVQPPVPPVAPVAPVPVQPPVPPVAPVAPVPVQPPVPPVAPVAPVPVQPPAPPVAPVPPVPVQPPAPPVAPVVPAPVQPSGAPAFIKARSAEIYAKLCSDKIEDWRSAARDIAFVMGEDQILLVKKAYNHSDENVRLSAAKVLSRKRTPEARAILQQMAGDPSELVRSLIEKTLLILK